MEVHSRSSSDVLEMGTLKLRQKTTNGMGCNLEDIWPFGWRNILVTFGNFEKLDQHHLVQLVSFGLVFVKQVTTCSRFWF